MGLFGGDSNSSSNTSNTSTSNTTTRDIGLTGQNAVDSLFYLGQTYGIALPKLADTYGVGLSDLAASSRNAVDRGFDFSLSAIRETASTFDRSSSRLSENFANLVNAERDFFQRGTLAQAGTPAPASDIPSAGISTPVQGSASDSFLSPIVLIGIATVLIMLAQGGK